MKYKVNFTKTLTVTGVLVIEADSAEHADYLWDVNNTNGNYEHDKICYADNIEPNWEVDEFDQVTFVEPVSEEVTS